MPSPSGVNLLDFDLAKSARLPRIASFSWVVGLTWIDPLSR